MRTVMKIFRPSKSKQNKKFFCNQLFALLIIFICTIAATPITKDNNSIVIGLTGDVMLGRLVNKQISRTNYQYPWGDMLPLLKKTDLNLINLETTLTTSNKAVPKVFNFKSNPENVQTLKEARIDVVTLANNHILDFDVEGMKETLTTLDRAGTLHVGAGLNLAKAQQPVIISKNDIIIGIVGYTDNEPGWKAAADKPGTNYIHVGTHKHVIEEIKELKKKVNILIFTIHWGPNMVQRPSKTFQAFAHSMIDAGVDIFHGHSAHIFQGIEIYKNKVIFYDTGDFVDDYYVTPSLRNDRSFLFLVEVDRQEIRGVQLVPVLVSHMQVNKAVDKDKEEMVKRMKALSQPFGTSIIESNEGVFVHIKTVGKKMDNM